MDDGSAEKEKASAMLSAGGTNSCPSGINQKIDLFRKLVGDFADDVSTK